MTRLAKLWWGAATIFLIVNIFGLLYAVAEREQEHAAIHVVLLLVGAVVAWAAAARTRRQERMNPMSALPPADERLATLQQSVDAIAIELERLGEAQRYREKLEVQRKEPEH